MAEGPGATPLRSFSTLQHLREWQRGPGQQRTVLFQKASPLAVLQCCTSCPMPSSSAAIMPAAETHKTLRVMARCASREISSSILRMRRWLRTTHGPAGAGGRIRGGGVRPHPLLPHLVRLVHRVQRKVHEQGSLDGRLEAFGRWRLRGVPVQSAVRFRDEHAEIICQTRTATMALAGRGGVNQPP